LLFWIFSLVLFFRALSLKYISQHSQPVFFPELERPSFKPV
jgi:tryptophan-rich sensory protein